MSKLTSKSVLGFIQDASTPQTKREIARAFGIKGSGPRVELKKILKGLEDEGAVSKFPGGGFGVPDGLPSVMTLEVVDIDIDGDVLARPSEWNDELSGAAPRIEIMPDNKGHPALIAGDRVLARLNKVDTDAYEARTIRKLDGPQGQVIGMLKIIKRGAILQPADKKAKHDFDVIDGELKGAQDGDLVIGEVQPSQGVRNKKVRITEVIGKRGDPKTISIISMYEAGLSEAFPESVIQDTQGLKVPPLGSREDLRGVPLVTIDGADARDFDDAVFAEPTDGGGFHLIVAIADVAHYVRYESALDKEAYKRGNSTYFPDRVVPMLPEALSNDLCSLRPDEDRACLAVHMWIDQYGEMERYKFVRGLMRSHARLIYEQVQTLYDEGNKQEPLYPVLRPLYAAFGVLDKARQKRGALDLDLPERQIIIDDKGQMTGVKMRTRVDAHKLIEEFMILANVAAAKALEDKKASCVYRVHERPSTEKIESAREFIESFGLSLPKGGVANPAQINHVLKKAAELPYSHLISQVILRSQSQAVYSAQNKGHFGLALSKYGHFTSPIRRYSDLLVHRSLIRAYKLGDGGLDEGEEAQLDEACEHISATERTSMQAERSAVDRFTAAYLSEKIGAEFPGRITGVTRFGLFVMLNESGADGIIPMRSMSNDFYVHDEKAHALVGRRTGAVFRLGADVTVRLKEADGLTGSTVLELCGASVNGADIPGMAMPRSAGKPQRRDRGGKGGKGKPGKRKPSKTKKTTPKHKRNKGKPKKTPKKS